MQRQKQTKFLLILLVCIISPLLFIGDPNVYADPPNAPTSVTATAISGSKVKLTWTSSTLNQITATGGTVTTSNGIETHTFTSTGTFTVTSITGSGTGKVNMTLKAAG